MDKEIKDYKDESNEEKNNNIMDIGEQIDNNEVYKDSTILNIKNEEITKENELKIDNIEYSIGIKEDLIKENINTNECINDKKQLKRRFNLTKKNITILLILCIAIILLSSNILKTVSNYENKTFPGTLIYEYDLSSLEKEEFLIELNKIEKNINKNKIKVNIDNKTYDIQLNNLISKYNNDKLFEDIIKKQKEKNIISRYLSIITKKNVNYNLYVQIDENTFKTFNEEISQDINIECIEPKVIINDKKISYNDGVDGLKLDEESLSNDIKEYLNSKNLLKENIIINGKLIKDTPKISLDDLKLINQKISTYTTTYVSGNARGSNVENAANKIDDLLLMPGEEFSYENSVGPVIESNGYKYAPVISGGKLVNGIGGGVCQVSSTLYNTQLNAGILPTERRNHSKAVSYVPRGLDATLASGSIDYKFKNTYEYPLVINTKSENGKLTIEIWSNKDALKGITYKPVSYANGKVANTYLYGYDKNNNKVYEKHIDTSVYR